MEQDVIISRKANTLNSERQYKHVPVLNVSTPAKILAGLLLALLVLLIFLPFVLAVLYSFLPLGLMPNIRSFSDIADNITLQGYRDVFNQLTFFHIMGNSIFISMVSTLLQIVIAFITAYAITHWDYPGKEYILGFIIVVMIIPTVALILPNYMTISNLEMVNTFGGVIVPGVANAYGIFLMRQFFIKIPRNLIEACRLDGAGEIRILWHVYLPTCRSAVTVLFIILLVANWNDYHWPMLILHDPDKLTLPLALVRFRDEAVIEWRSTIAASLMTMIPVALMYVFIQKRLIETFAATISKE